MKTLFTKSKVLPFFTLAGIGYLGLASIFYSTTPPPVSHTNAPGENNCTSCHAVTLNPNPTEFLNSKPFKPSKLNPNPLRNF